MEAGAELGFFSSGPVSSVKTHDTFENRSSENQTVCLYLSCAQKGTCGSALVSCLRRVCCFGVCPLNRSRARLLLGAEEIRIHVVHVLEGTTTTTNHPVIRLMMSYLIFQPIREQHLHAVQQSGRIGRRHVRALRHTFKQKRCLVDTGLLLITKVSLYNH